MSKHLIYRVGPTIQMSSTPASLLEKLIRVTTTKFGVQNADGTTTYFHGIGFVFDPSTNEFSQGEITSAIHYSATGLVIDKISGLSLLLPAQTGLITGVVNWSTVFTGDDFIDARVRFGKAVVNDKIDAGLGNDFVYSGSGDDTVQGGGGNDRVRGGTGNDILSGDLQFTLAGNDKLFGESGNDILFGNGGNDVLNGGSGIDTAVFGTSFSTLKIVKTETGFIVTSSDGTDTLKSIEKIATDEGTFTYDHKTKAWTQTDRVSGTAQLDPSKVYLWTEPPPRGEDISQQYSVVQAFDLDDRMAFNYVKNNLVIRGGGGSDFIDGKSFANIATSHRIYGEDGDDTIIDSFGNDMVFGGAGNDYFAVTLGNDIMSGGTGADTFYFAGNVTPGNPTNPKISWGNDVITDFVLGVDHLQFTNTSNLVLSQTFEGVLITSNFVGSDGIVTEATLLLQGLNAPSAVLTDFLA